MRERVLGTFVDVIDGEIGIEDHWKVVEISKASYMGRNNVEYELKKTNPSGTVGWVAGAFTREGLIGLRDLLTQVLEGTADE